MENEFLEKYQFYYDNLTKSMLENHPLSESKIRTAQDSNSGVILEVYRDDMFRNSAVAAISAYHDVLRERLLSQGIDIGDFL